MAAGYIPIMSELLHEMDATFKRGGGGGRIFETYFASHCCSRRTHIDHNNGESILGRNDLYWAVYTWDWQINIILYGGDVRTFEGTWVVSQAPTRQ